MGRPKGSKNKPKGILETVKEAVVEAATEAVEEVIEEEFKEPTAFVESPKPQPWTAQPNMGDIKPPKAEEFPCGCGHIKAVHYGPETDWCNKTGCNCQRFN